MDSHENREDVNMQVRELTNREIEVISRQMVDLVDSGINPHYSYLNNVNNYIAWKKQNRLSNTRNFEKRLSSAVERRLEEMAKDPSFNVQRFEETIPELLNFIKNIIQEFKSNLDQPGITSQDKLFLEYLSHVETLCHSLAIITATKDKVIDNAGINFSIGADHLAEMLSAISPTHFPPQLAAVFHQIDEWPILPSTFEYLHTSMVSIYMTRHTHGNDEHNNITKLTSDTNNRLVEFYVAEFLLFCRETANNPALTADAKSKIICDFVDANINAYGDLYHAALLKLSESHDLKNDLCIPDDAANRLQQMLAMNTEAQPSQRSEENKLELVVQPQQSEENKLELAMQLITELINSDHWRSKSGRNITPGAIEKLRNFINANSYNANASPEEKQRFVTAFFKGVNSIILEHMNKRSLFRDDMTKDFYKHVSDLTNAQDMTKVTAALRKLKEMHYQTIVQPREILAHLRQFLATPEWQNITPGISKLQSILKKAFAGEQPVQHPLKVLRSLAEMSDLFTKPATDHFSATKINDIKNPLSRELHSKLKKLYSAPYDQAARSELLNYISQNREQQQQATLRSSISQ